MKFNKTRRFRQSAKRVAKRGKSVEKLKRVIYRIYKSKLEPKHKDHALKGEWIGYRECHIEPDWLLVYKWIGDILMLADTGSHVDIFGK